MEEKQEDQLDVALRVLTKECEYATCKMMSPTVNRHHLERVVGQCRNLRTQNEALKAENENLTNISALNDFMRDKIKERERKAALVMWEVMKEGVEFPGSPDDCTVVMPGKDLAMKLWEEKNGLDK